MKILICICTYKRNDELIKSLKEFQNIQIPKNFEVKFLVLDNTRDFLSKKIIKKFKKKSYKSLDRVNFCLSLYKIRAESNKEVGYKRYKVLKKFLINFNKTD